MFIVMYHSLLIGASLFVPIPFVDERLAAYLWRRMVAELAKQHGRALTDAQLDALSYQYKFVLSDGCLMVFKRVFKQLSQELIFFLEWGKALDLATNAYYSGYMLNELFSYEAFDTAKIGHYAVAMQNAKKGFNMKLVRDVLQGTFRSGRGVVFSLVRWLSSTALGFLKGRGRRAKNDPAFEKNMSGFFEENKAKLEDLIGQLKAGFDEGLGQLPKNHFDELRSRFFAEVARLETAQQPIQSA